MQKLDRSGTATRFVCLSLSIIYLSSSHSVFLHHSVVLNMTFHEVLRVLLEHRCLMVQLQINKPSPCRWMGSLQLLFLLFLHFWQLWFQSLLGSLAIVYFWRICLIQQLRFEVSLVFHLFYHSFYWPVLNFVEVVILLNTWSQTDPEYDLDIKEDVQEECSNYGHVKHIYVDK